MSLPSHAVSAGIASTMRSQFSSSTRCPRTASGLHNRIPPRYDGRELFEPVSLSPAFDADAHLPDRDIRSCTEAVWHRDKQPCRQRGMRSSLAGRPVLDEAQSMPDLPRGRLSVSLGQRPLRGRTHPPLTTVQRPIANHQWRGNGNHCVDRTRRVICTSVGGRAVSAMICIKDGGEPRSNDFALATEPANG
jgi:hypothetical protein